MKKLVALFARRRDVNLTTEFARQRVERAMPGEIGSMQSLRLTGVSL